jgi:citrate lyase subunit beta / citryl-CoA lyase
MTPIRTVLFSPGSAPPMMAKALNLHVDVVILDLEDAVSPEEKETAREHVVQALGMKALPQRWVRINPVGAALQITDLERILPGRPDGIVVPKADLAAIEVLGRQLDEYEAAGGNAPPIIALIETCLGLIEVAGIARHPRNIGFMLGAEDFTAELGVPRTVEGKEILLARQQLAITARAFNSFAIDTPHLGINDVDALRQDVAVARSLGMTGKACIHPRQVELVHKGFSPTNEECQWAQRVLLELEKSFAEGRGACTLDGKMIDAPVAARARRILASAPMTQTN